MTDIRTFDLNLLRVLNAIYQTRNVTRAAERLALTQSTVSGMLKRLREAFDDALFLRTAGGMVPTPRAEALALPVKALLDQADSILTPQSFDPDRAPFALMLCGSDYLQHLILRPFASLVLNTHPGAQVSVSERPASGQVGLLERGELDVGVALREIVPEPLTAMTLLHDGYVCIARQAHPLPEGPVSLAELCRHDHAFVDPTGHSFRGPVDAALDRIGHRRRVALAVPTFHALFAALAVRDLLAFVPARLLAMAGPGFKRLQTPLDTAPLDIVAYWHPRMNDDPRHRWLRHRLRAFAAEIAPT